ncbi:MAG TPA: hypothetical protein VJ922_09550 [Actinomycetota bacterium]|nr:hypothetical protein [Actinomycetota bacterium]
MLRQVLRRERSRTDAGVVFEQLDFLYIPSTDVAADAAYFTEVLGGRLAFAIDDDGARVAMVEMTEGPPALLFTDHLEGDRTIFIYRVTNLRRALKELADRGWEPEETFEIPQGPCCSFVTPKGQRVALYERTRPDVESHFLARRDF